MSGVRIHDTAIYLIWAYQGVLFEEIYPSDDYTSLNIQLSIPSDSFMRDQNNEVVAGKNLYSRVKDCSEIVAMSLQFNQGISVNFNITQRDEFWTKTDASNSVKEMLYRLMMGNPFEGAM